MELLPMQKDSFFIRQDRPDGLALKIVWDKDRVYSDLRLGERFNGETAGSLDDILFGIMDVMMWCAILVTTGKVCAARKANTYFIKPVAYDELITASGHCIHIDGKDIYVMAYIKDASGDICAMVDAVFRENKELPLDRVIKCMDFTGTSSKVKMFFQSLLTGSHIALEEVREDGENYPYGPL